MSASIPCGERSPEATPASADSDFSLVAGGPFYNLYRRVGLAGVSLEHVVRRVLVIALCTWVPLLLLSFIEGDAWSGVKVPFLKDAEAHLRLLIALPFLVGAEWMIHDRMRGVAAEFVAAGLVLPADQSRFDRAVASAFRWRDSTVAEVLLLVIVYTVGVAVFWQNAVHSDVPTWYARGTGRWAGITLAGTWYRLVSMPLFQFMLLRWYFRLFIWMRFIWQTSRLKLNLIAMHPDGSGGLDFLNTVCYAFLPLMLGQGAAAAAVMADGIFFRGKTLLSYELELGGLAVLTLLWSVVPFLPLVPAMAHARRIGLLSYGELAERYVRDFERKWLRPPSPEESLLGSADIQSLADLANGFNVVKGMQLHPVDLLTVVILIVAMLLPVVPLVLTMIPLDRLLSQLLAVIV
jgi:hypothetical protein